MTPPRSLILVGVVLLLLILAALGTGVWWYLAGPNEMDSAELVPANTVFFASIPNATSILAGYETSKLKTLVESPHTQPLHDTIVKWIGPKNIDVFNALLPNLSGQSFIAITHFDYDHPEQVGLIAAMKPKPGTGNFDAFVDKLKATWPDVLKQGTTGTATVEGVNYDWIQGPGAPDKICVAQIKGWIVTTWGEASLQDWIERSRKKSDTSSLADDLNYRKALERVGDDPMTLVYVNYHALMEIVQKQEAKTNPALSDFLGKKIDSLGGAALATRFENGEIVDRFTFLIPHPTQVNIGLGTEPCPFDTLKFTGPDTRFYWAAGVDWKQYYDYIKEQANPASDEHAALPPMTSGLLSLVENWVHGTSLDPHQNIIDALGSEISVQAEWSADAPFPEIGGFVKVDKPDDFKPTIAAIIDTVRKAYATTAVVSELSSNGQNFATLQFVQSSPISPTITEGGPYLGVFLTENQAVRSFQRTDGTGLAHNADFSRQTGDRLKTATQVLFLDSPRLLNRAYEAAMPYVSLAGMFDKNIGAMLKGYDLPPDLTWLGPMGTWTCVTTPDEEGVQVYSVSGIGNQGIPLAMAMGEAGSVLQSMGWLPKAETLAKSAAVPAASVVSPPPTPVPPQTNAAGNGPVASSPALSSPPLADGVSGPTVAGDNTGAIIYITADDKIFFNSTAVPLDEFADFLQNKKAALQGQKVVVRVDRDASSDVLSRVMDAGTMAGFGVLPYTYTTGANSLPPQPNTNSAPPNAPPQTSSPSPSAAVNALPATNSIPDATSSVPPPAVTK